MADTTTTATAMQPAVTCGYNGGGAPTCREPGTLALARPAGATQWTLHPSHHIHALCERHATELLALWNREED
jgi:hypothetical protein